LFQRHWWEGLIYLQKTERQHGMDLADQTKPWLTTLDMCLGAFHAQLLGQEKTCQTYGRTLFSHTSVPLTFVPMCVSPSGKKNNLSTL